MGAATVSGPQGTFKVREDGTFNLLESRWSSNNLHMEGTFENHELRRVAMTVGGALGTPGDRIEFRNDGRLYVNGELCTGDLTTRAGTRVSHNGDQVVIQTPDGDSFSMYLSFCQPPSINLEGSLAPSRAQGDVAGLVGTFDDAIPEGQFPEGLGGTRAGNPDTHAFWASWAQRRLEEAAEKDEQRRKETAAEAERAARKGADARGGTANETGTVPANETGTVTATAPGRSPANA